MKSAPEANRWSWELLLATARAALSKRARRNPAVGMLPSWPRQEVRFSRPSAYKPACSYLRSLSSSSTPMESVSYFVSFPPIFYLIFLRINKSHFYYIIERSINHLFLSGKKWQQVRPVIDLQWKGLDFRIDTENVEIN